MTRHFMRDTPLYQMEQMMMTPPYFKPRGHGLRRSGFRYQAKDVDCEYCMNYSRRNLCPLDQCICLEERIETGALSLEELLRDCLNSKPKMSLWRRLAQLLYQQSLQFFRTDEHRRRWMHWRTRYHRLSQRNQAALFLLTAYPFIVPIHPRLQDSLIGSHISAIKSSIGKRGIIMENIDLCGVIQLLRSLVAQKKATEKEARKILSRIAAQTGASIVISF